MGWRGGSLQANGKMSSYCLFIGYGSFRVTGFFGEFDPFQVFSPSALIAMLARAH